MQLELISFKLCPFTQCAIILLNYQKIDFKMTHINPMELPDWFLAISPTGKVPLLKADDEIIFESNVISEFINDISPTNLHPKNAVKKANNRSWIAFSSLIFDDLFNIITGDEAKFNTAKTQLFSKLTQIEALKTNTHFFNGDDFQMIDAAFAPIFMRLAWINEFTNNALSLSQLPQLSLWADAVLNVEAVKTSVVEGLDDVYYSNIEAREGYLSTLLTD